MSAGDLPERLRRLAQRTDTPPAETHAVGRHEGTLEIPRTGATLPSQNLHTLGSISGQGLVESAEPTPTAPRTGTTESAFADAIWAQESHPEPTVTGAGRDIDMAINGPLPQHRAPPDPFGAPPDPFGAPPASGPALGFGGVIANPSHTAGLAPTYATLPREQVESGIPSPTTTASWLTRGSNIAAIAVLLGGLVYLIYRYASKFLTLSVTVRKPDETPPGTRTSGEHELDTSDDDDYASTVDPEMGGTSHNNDDEESVRKHDASARPPANPAMKQSRRSRGSRKNRENRESRKRDSVEPSQADAAVHVDPQFRPLDGTEAAVSAPEA